MILYSDAFSQIAYRVIAVVSPAAIALSVDISGLVPSFSVSDICISALSVFSSHDALSVCATSFSSCITSFSGFISSPASVLSLVS